MEKEQVKTILLKSALYVVNALLWLMSIDEIEQKEIIKNSKQ